MLFEFSFETDESSTLDAIEDVLNHYFNPKSTPYVIVDGVTYTTEVEGGKLKVKKAEMI